MYDTILSKLKSLDEPIDVIVVGLGFMGFGFVSNALTLTGIRIPIIISRRVDETISYLKKNKIKAISCSDLSKIKKYVEKGYICVSHDLNLIQSYPNKVVFEVTGTVVYGAEVALATIAAGKHLVTMNPELQVTVGHELKKLADKKKVIITDVVGDQPGSLSRLIHQARLMGFKPVLAGNMKRYLDQYATQKQMQPWADDKGLAVRQTTSFTDGTKQSIEMNLVANYFGFSILQSGMKGPQIDSIQDVLNSFDFSTFPNRGVVDYVLGKNLFPGVFVVVKHTDPRQQKYLRYLSLGTGPYYVLFDSYHLCHLEAALSIVNAVLFSRETINNSTKHTQTVAKAKRNLKKGETLDGIGGDTVYGVIDHNNTNNLPVGLIMGAVLKRDIPQDTVIKAKDVVLPDNVATRLAGFISGGKIAAVLKKGILKDELRSVSISSKKPNSHKALKLNIHK